MEDKIDYTDNIKKLKDNLNKMTLYCFVKKSIFDLPVFNGIKPSSKEPIEKFNIVLHTKDLSLKYDVSTEDYLNLLDKEELLKSNLFRLLDLQDNLNSNSLNFLISEYKDFLVDKIKSLEKLNRDNKYTDSINCLIIKKYLDLQQELFNSHLEEINNTFFNPKFNSELTKPLITKQEPKPRLKDLIIKGNAELIEKIIVDNFKNSKNVTIHRMFIALEKLGYIKIEYGSRNHIIECFNNSIGSYNFKYKSVFVKEIDFMSDKEYLKTRNYILSLIENSNNKN